MRRGDEALEERMRRVGFALEFGVKLAGDEKRVGRKLDEFHQFSIGGRAAENKARGAKLFPIGVIEFVAMAVALIDDKGSVEAVCLGADD